MVPDDPKDYHAENPKFQRKFNHLLESAPELKNYNVLVSAIKK